MNTKLTRRFLLTTCAAAAQIALMGNHSAQACAELTPEEVKAPITDEAAVIVWDAKTGTEHFIRRATFDSSASPKAAKNIGFLVPTPTMPEIAAADAEIFDNLNLATEPVVQTKTLRGYKVGWILTSGRRVSTVFSAGDAELDTSVAPGATRQSVQVEKSVRVGDYTATVLAARDTNSLTTWLKAHKYQTNDSINAWLTPYIKQGWKITAFKIANTDSESSFDLTPVRLSFKTDKPYYPYREPASARAKGNFATTRALRIFYIGDKRVTGSIGQKGAKSWPGNTQWTAPLPTAQLAVLKNNGIPQAALASSRMTVFRDPSSPRPGTDEVFFATAHDQTVIEPAPIVKIDDRRVVIPFELLLLVLIGFCIGSMKLANRIAENRPSHTAG